MSAWWAREATKKSGRPRVADEHRRDHRHVRQVRAAVIGAVEQPGIPGAQPLAAGVHHRAHARAHRAQVHGHVRGVGDQATARIEQRARVVEALADVDRLRRRLQHLAHLLGDVHEQVVEDLDARRVGGGGGRRAAAAGILEQQLSARQALHAPAFLHHHGTVRLDDERRTCERCVERRCGHQRHFAPGAEPGAGARRQRRIRRRRRHGERCGLDRGLACLDAQRFDHHLQRVGGEAEAAQVVGMEALAHGGECAGRYRERDVAVAGPQLEQVCDPHRRGRRAVRAQLGARLRLERLAAAASRRQARRIERAAQAGAAHRQAVGHADAERRQHARQRMHQDTAHARGARHAAGMLAGGTAEAEQREVTGVAPLARRHLADGIGHRLDPDFQERLGHGLGRAAARHLGADLRGERGEALRHGRGVDARAAIAAEHRRQRVGAQPPEQYLGIGEGERATAAVAHRPGVGAGGGRPDREAAVAVAEDRAAAGGDAVHVEHRLRQAHAGDQMLEALRQLAVDERDVGRGAAHVKTDEARQVEPLAHPAHADQAPGRPRQHARHGVEAGRRGQAAVALHERQARRGVERAHLGGECIDVVAQRQRQVGIEHGGIPARHVAHQRRQLVRHRHLLEAELAREGRGRLLVLRMAPAVQKHDGHGAPPGGAGARQVGTQPRQVERGQHLALRVDALARFQHARVQALGQHDVAREDVGAVLVADAQRVGEPGGGDQQHRLAAARQQRIGGHGGADLDRTDRGAAGGRAGEDGTGRGQPRVAGGAAGHAGQHLAHVQHALRRHADHVREGAAAVDPELPAGGRVRGCLASGFHCLHYSRL